MTANADRIRNLIEVGSHFTFGNFSSRTNSQYGGTDTSAWLSWKTNVEIAVGPFVPPGTALDKMFNDARKIATEGNGPDRFEKQHGLLMAVLESTLDFVKDKTRDDLDETTKVSSPSKVLSNEVFIVHGHDHQLKDELAIFLSDIGLEPIILHRQPDQGKTIIEKFEAHSNVGFAFVLLTPDEVAYTVDQIKLPEIDRITEFRARANVIFEFGFFVGKLNRSRVCCLIKGSVSRPSDLGGLVYKEVVTNIEGIGYSIIKELKAAGNEVKLG